MTKETEEKFKYSAVYPVFTPIFEVIGEKYGNLAQEIGKFIKSNATYPETELHYKGITLKKDVDFVRSWKVRPEFKAK